MTSELTQCLNCISSRRKKNRILVTVHIRDRHGSIELPSLRSRVLVFLLCVCCMFNVCIHVQFICVACVYILWLLYYVSAMPSPSPRTLCTFFPALWDSCRCCEPKCLSMAAVSHRCGCLPDTPAINNWHGPIAGKFQG